MTLNSSVIRTAVFLQWFLTLIVLALSFAYATRTSLRSIGEAIDAIELVAAVVIPQLSVIVTFYIAGEPAHAADVHQSRSGFWIILACTTVYHVTFVVLALVLIAFGHDEIGASAKMLVKVMGILSPLGIAPVARLFAAP